MRREKRKIKRRKRRDRYNIKWRYWGRMKRQKMTCACGPRHMPVRPLNIMQVKSDSVIFRTDAYFILIKSLLTFLL